MKTLFWKDLRLLRGVVIGVVATALSIALLIPTFDYLDSYLSAKRVGEASRSTWIGSFINELQGMSSYWALVGLACGIIGAIAFAWERSERWADFLDLLPVTRRAIVLSKLQASLVVMASLFLACAIASVMAAVLIDHWHATYPGPNELINSSVFRRTLISFAGTAMTSGLLVFGCGWLFSSILKSPITATAVAFGVVGAILIFQNTNRLFDHPDGRPADPPTASFIRPIGAANAVLGIVFVAIGAMAQMRRESP